MPANLPAEAKKKWYESSMAKDPKEKLQLLQEFLSMVPKHKGTEKLRAQVKTKMAVLRREMSERKRRRAGRRGSRYFVEKEGAAQIVVLGPTNVGRSSLLASITNAKAEVSKYPFTTRRPVPGMLVFDGIQFQIVEAPAIVGGMTGGRSWGQQTLALARNADGLILMVDLSGEPLEQLSLILNELETASILVKRPSGRVEIERKHMGAGLRLVVVGRLVDCTRKDVEKLLGSYRVRDALVKIYGGATIDDVEEAIFESAVFRPVIVVANKIDVEGAQKKLRQFEENAADRFSVVPVSCKTTHGLKHLGLRLFKALEIIRVYTKEPNRAKHSLTPFILKRGLTIADLAKQIHSDFHERFSYAKVWSKRLAFSPQKVGSSFVLDDKDIVEIHAR